ncbi:MAG: TolC family protein [Myxococcales bacterium]|nr:TolC family protein [Myxococcales bacterium]
MESDFRMRLPAVWAGAILLMSGPFTASAAEPGLTLTEAIQSSLRHPRMRAAQEAVNQARAELQSAGVIPNPTLSIEGGLLPISRAFTPEKPGGPSELAGSLSYPIDRLLFGKRSAAIEAGEAALRVAEAEYADAVRQRTLEAALAFYDVLEWQHLLRVAQDSLGDLGQLEAAVQASVESGGRSQLDLARVRLAALVAQREARTIRAELDAARLRLTALLDPPREPASIVAAGSLDDPPPSATLSAEEAYQIAVQARPDILALRHQSALARSAELVEKRNAWPEASVGINVTHQFQQPIGAPDVTAFGVAFEMTLPFFDRNQGNRARAIAAASQAELELAAALLELRAEVQLAVQALATAEQNARLISEQELALATQIRDSIQQARASGGRPMIEFIDAQQSYRETYRAYVAGRAELWRAHARLQAAMGGEVTP